MIFDTQTRDLLGHHVDGSEAIQVIQFAPDGTMVALGSRDNHIYIYQVSNDGTKYSRVGKCTVRFSKKKYSFGVLNVIFVVFRMLFD